MTVAKAMFLMGGGIHLNKTLEGGWLKDIYLFCILHSTENTWEGSLFLYEVFMQKHTFPSESKARCGFFLLNAISLIVLFLMVIFTLS